MDKDEILRIAMQQSAYDCSCDAADFRGGRNSVHESRPCAEARKYLKLPHVCDLVSYGDNVVACGQRELLPALQAFLDGAGSPSACFESITQSL